MKDTLTPILPQSHATPMFEAWTLLGTKFVDDVQLILFLKWRCIVRFLFCGIVILLIGGCDYFDDDTIDPIIYDSTPVVIPTDADWELIATLERNPLRPATFYIFEWQNEAIESAYRAGKHFIFEIAGEYRETHRNKIRHYIIQPTPPFQDDDKHPGQLDKEKKDRGAFHVHHYVFLSEGWYVAKENRIGGGGQAIGLGVEFDLSFFVDEKRFEIGQTTIGLISTLDNPIIASGLSYIDGTARLRIYVSR